MNIVETNVDGLRHEFSVTIVRDEIDGRVDTRLKELGGDVNIPGFRPGKVPMKILKQRFGKAVLGEVMEAAVKDTTRDCLAERNLRPALQPKIELVKVGESEDLEYKIDMEALPEVPPVSLEDIELERLRVDVTEEMVTKGLDHLAEGRKSFAAPEETRPARDGDQVVVDFEGRLDGGDVQPEMSGENHTLEIGSGMFIPGFEEQMIGVETGDERTIDLTFPEDYTSAEHAGKPARFAVKVREVRAPVTAKVGDELARELGFDDLEGLRGRVREQQEQQFGRISRNRAKRALLDALAERVDFPIPVGLVNAEFDAMWQQIEKARTEQNEAREAGTLAESDIDADLDKPEEVMRAEFRGIAERRVRLGLLLAQVGQVNNIELSDQEVQQGVLREAMRYRGHEKEVINHYKETPGALESLRAPLFEDKVVDFILELVRSNERIVTVEELMTDPDEDGEAEAQAVTTAGIADDTDHGNGNGGGPASP